MTTERKLTDDYLQNIADIMSVLEELGSATNSQLGVNLVDENRYLLLAEDAEIKIGSIDNKSLHCRLYLFNNLLIIARYKSRKAKRKTLTGTGDKIVFGEIIGRKGSQHSFGSNSDDDDQSSKRTKGGSKIPTLKMKVWLDLNHVKVYGEKRKNAEGKDEFGMRIIYTRREKHIDAEDGSVEWVTKVEQSELWLENEDKQTRFLAGLHDAIDLVIESNMSYNQEADSDDDESVVSSDTSSDGSGGSKRKGKKRSYAKSKDTMREIARRRNKGTLSLSNTEGDLTLSEIAKRYQVDLKTGDAADTDDRAEFAVVFNAGAMGFAVSSLNGEDTGVFVGKITPGGMADLSGVTLMDRVIQVAEVKIDNSMTWQGVKEMIIQKRKKTDAKGNIVPLRVVFARQKNVDESVAKEKKEIEDEEKRLARRRARAARGGKRMWAAKRDKQRTFGNRMTTLKDLENKYKNAGKNEKRQAAMTEIFDKVIKFLKSPESKSLDAKHEIESVHILKEIHDTEKAYVHHLYSLIDNYKRKMEKSKLKVKCKDLRLGATKFCEHGRPTFACQKSSSEIRPVATKEEIKKVFANVEVITKVNEQLLHALQEGLEKLNEKKAKDIRLADIIAVYAPAFVKTMPFFKMYSVYASQYSSALEYLSDMKDRKDFRDFLAGLEAKKNVMSIQSLLIQPVSRLCKYPLLFENLTKASHKYGTALAEETLKTGSGDMITLEKMLDDLDAILDSVSEVANSVNLKVGEHHDLEQLSVIYAELGGAKGIKDFMVPSRKFVLKAEVLIVDKMKNKPKPKPSYIYLFNDLILFATDKSGTMKKLTQKKLSEMKKTNKGTMTMGSDSNSVTSSKGTQKKNSGGKNTLKKAKVKVTLRSDIMAFKRIKPMSQLSKDGFPGFTFNHVSYPDSPTEPYVAPYEIHCYSEEDRDMIAEQIKTKQDEFKKAKKERDEMKRKYGLKGKQRGYKTKKNSTANHADLKRKLADKKAGK